MDTLSALKPIYMRHTSTKDMEMCYSHLHFHSRYSINALIKCDEKQGTATPFNDYCNFYANCQPDESIYIHWHSTHDEKSF